MPPPIRYPLPMFVGVCLAGVLVWKGAALATPVWEAVAERVRKAAAGPDFPSSDEPRVVAGSIRDRVLLLHEETEVTDRPGGSVVETIGKPGFADIYDVWPFSGEPTHYRIGNRSPLGWVQAGQVLHWPTRLACRPAGRSIVLADTAGSEAEVEADPALLPILGWDGPRFQVAAWDAGQPWRQVRRVGWAALDQSEVGVLLSRTEIVALLGRIAEWEGPGADSLRLRALTGRVLDGASPGEADLAAARAWLPAVAWDRGERSTREKTNALARLNESWQAEARWGGLEFRLVPLEWLP